MYIENIEINSIRGFVKGNNNILNFSPTVNLIVGQNNSGKSTIIKAIYSFQNEAAFNKTGDVRFDEAQGNVIMRLNGNAQRFLGTEKANYLSFVLSRISRNIREGYYIDQFNKKHSLSQTSFQNERPNNFMFYHSADRKMLSYSGEIDLSRAKEISGTHQFLSAKVEELKGDQHPLYDQFNSSCEQILGFKVSSLQTSGSNNKIIGIYVGRRGHTELSRI